MSSLLNEFLKNITKEEKSTPKTKLTEKKEKVFVRVTPENDYLLEIDAKCLDLDTEPVKKSKIEPKRDLTKEKPKKKVVDEEARLKMQEIMIKKAETDLFSGRRCSICQSGGISLNSDCNLTDAAALNYVLYECSKCRAAVHRDCIPWDTPDFYDPKGNNLHLWKCAFCKSGLSLNNCLICNSNTEGLRKRVGSNNIHYVCGQLFGIQMGSDNEIINGVLSLKQNGGMTSVCSICEKSGGSTRKCSILECNATFHPICLSKKRFYLEGIQIEGETIVNVLCEQHSKEAFRVIAKQSITN